VSADSAPRLLVLTPDFAPAFGGIQLVATRIVENLHRFEAHVVTFDEPGAAAFDRTAGVPVRRTPRSSIPRVSNLLLNAGALRDARSFRPDVILSVHIVTAPAARVVQAIARVPFVQYAHADEVPERPRLSRLAVARATAVIAVSKYTRQLAIEAGADPGRVERIPPGVDLPPPRTASRSESPIVVTLARLTDRYKGHDVMIRALPRIRESVPDVRWVVVGDGPLREELVELARDGGVSDCVEFTGSVSDSERDAWLDRAHVFAMPSRLPVRGQGGEGFGIVYLEAGAHSLPVVAGNVAGALDAVVDGETGLLVDPTSPGAVSDAISGLLLDPERADTLGRAGAARAAEFAWPKIAARVENLLLRIVNRA
jgi:phosphatidyl-myo-inositol dimannoside synthase